MRKFAVLLLVLTGLTTALVACGDDSGGTVATYRCVPLQQDGYP